MNGIIKEYEMGYKRGVKIKYFNRIGKIKIGRFMMVGDRDGFIVIKNENGEVELVDFSKVINN